MTVISILSGDFELAMDDETVGGNAVAGLKTIRRGSSPSSTIYTTNALYSATVDAMDSQAGATFDDMMKAQTPAEYRLPNGVFMPRIVTEFLKGGAIESISWTTEIRSIAYTDTVADFVAGDIGRQVTGGTTGDTGTLLDFEVLNDGSSTKIAWIRPDDPATDLFDNASETLTVTGDGGTGNCTSTAVSTTGESLYPNIEVIGGVATNSEVSIIQARQKLPQFWPTDPTLALGIIDVLIRTKRDDVEIADGLLEVRSGRYTGKYDFFTLDVSAGGRKSMPLATGDDINNTTGYRNATWTAGTGSAMQVGDLITNTTQVGAFAVVTAVTDGGATGDFDYYLVGDLNDFAGSDTFTSPNRNGTIGTVTNTVGGPLDAGVGQGGSVVISLGTRTFDHDNDGTAEPYSAEVDAQGDVPQAKVYERIKYANRRGADEADLFGAGVNMPGEQYRGMEIFAPYDNPVGTFGEGEDVDVVATSFTARSMAVNTTDAYVTLMDPFRALANNDVLRDEGLDTVDILGAPTVLAGAALKKESPLGTSTGTQIFGARGILFSNPHADDTQAYILTDDNGALRTPPNTVSVIADGVATGDYVVAADDTGVAGIIDKDRFGGSHASNNSAGSATFEVAGSIDTDVAASGFLRVVDDSTQTEQRYRYSSRSSTVFTLIETSGTSDSGGATTLIDAAGDFVNQDVQAGDIVRNTIEGVSVLVVSRDSATQLTTEDLTLFGGTDWGTDTYTVGQLDRAYVAADNVYAPIIDRITVAGDAGVVSNSVVQSTPFGIRVDVRQGKVIFAFTQNATVGANGVTIPVNRILDTIAT